MLNIAYITDQILPQTATDTEQLVSMCAALGVNRANVTLYGPRHFLKKMPGTGDIADYYQVPETFAYYSVGGPTPSIRGLEKMITPALITLKESVRSSDLIYTRNLPAVLWALGTTRMPVAFETYRPWPDQKPHMKRFFRWMGNHRNTAGLILHSEIAARSFRNAGVPDEKLLVAHNGYNSRIMQPYLSREEAKARFELDPGRPVVTYTGRVSMKKGLDMLLEQASARPDVTFLVVGSEHWGTFERRARSFNNIRIIGWQPLEQLPPFLYASDILFIPPASAPFKKTGNTVLPMKTFLYMAAQRPIIAPASDDLLEVLTDRETAVLVRPDDQQSLDRNLDELLSDRTLQEQLAANAYRKVQQQTWKKRAETVLRFLHERLDPPLQETRRIL